MWQGVVSVVGGNEQGRIRERIQVEPAMTGTACVINSSMCQGKILDSTQASDQAKACQVKHLDRHMIDIMRD